MNAPSVSLATDATLASASAPAGIAPSDRRRLRIASVCTLFPTSAEPHKGIFVARRVSHLSMIADVKALQPLPWFPFLRPQQIGGVSGEDEALPLCRQRMFYLPGAFKRLDGYCLFRSIYPVLKRWHDESGLDLVDAHFGYPEGVGAVAAARRLGLPVFVTLRGNEKEYLQQPAIRKQLIDALQACSGIIAVSKSLSDAICSAGIDERKVTVIPNAIDGSQFSPGARDAARSELGLPLEAPTIVSVGQLIQRKGHDFLVRAVHELRSRHPDVVLAIVGGSSFERDFPIRLRRLIESLDMGVTVRLVGAQPPDKIAKWLHAADVFALCTRREGCCNAVLESLACGIPVVTTPVGDNAVYVQPRTNGYLVPRDDPGATCNALDAALEQSWDPQAISRSLQQDGWGGVAREVVKFFHARLPDATNGRSTEQR